jgi:hypothetical protein
LFGLHPSPERATDGGRPLRSFTLRRECGTEPGQVAGVSHIGRQEERNAGMLCEIRPTSANEQTSVPKRDRLEEPTGKDVRHISVAIEKFLDVERERCAHERLPVRGECVLLDLMDEDPCQRPALVDVVDLGATDGRVNVDRKRTHVG